MRWTRNWGQSIPRRPPGRIVNGICKMNSGFRARIIINHEIKTRRRRGNCGETGERINKIITRRSRTCDVPSSSLKSFHSAEDQWVLENYFVNGIPGFIEKRMVLWSSSIFSKTTYEWYSDGHYSKIKHSSTMGHNSNTEQYSSFIYTNTPIPVSLSARLIKHPLPGPWL